MHVEDGVERREVGVTGEGRGQRVRPLAELDVRQGDHAVRADRGGAEHGGAVPEGDAAGRVDRGGARPRHDRPQREAHAGEWEGLTPEEIELRWPGWLEAHHRPAGFEPYPAVVERATEALHDVAARAAANGTPAALVVAHSGVARSLVRHLGGIDSRIPNLGGVWFTASVIDGRSDLVLGDVFDPAGVILTGVDAPGEDPGEETDEADAQRAAEH